MCKEGLVNESEEGILFGRFRPESLRGAVYYIRGETLRWPRAAGNLAQQAEKILAQLGEGSWASQLAHAPLG
jgi:hypothetical protein